jgi:pimeloyl-ACP methyl ester carboxylesterase
MIDPPQGWRRAMEWILVVVAIALVLPAAAWLAQDRLIFFPQPVLSTSHLPGHASPLEVTAADGTHLRGWMVRGATNPAPAVLYFGGNAEEVSWTLADARWPRDWTIVGVNYRGYGGSEGKPGERELTADALEIYDALAARDDVDRRRIVVFGRSLGSAMAVHVAARRPVAGAILVSPFDSLAAVGRDHYAWLPVALLLKHRFDALADARAIHAPATIIVGDSDSIIRAERSRALFDAWAGPKTWREVRGADHNTLGAFDAYWADIAGALGAY